MNQLRQLLAELYRKKIIIVLCAVLCAAALAFEKYYFGEFATTPKKRKRVTPNTRKLTAPSRLLKFALIWKKSSANSKARTDSPLAPSGRGLG